MTELFKKQVILAFRAHFERELQHLIQSAKSAHAAATHEESRAEDRHDTFAIEASYLAAGQAARVQDLRASVTEMNQLLEHLSRPESRVQVGALVILESADKKTISLLAKFGGGTLITVDGTNVSLLSPSSPLGENCLGLSTGEDFSVETKAGMKEYSVLEFC